MGRVLAPYGVKGWIKVQPFTASPESLAGYDHWWFSEGGDWAESDIAEVAVHGSDVVARPAGCTDRDQAVKYRGREVAIPREAFPEAGKDEFYWADLVGLEVVNMQGEVLGEVAGLLSSGVQDILRVSEGTRSGKDERLIPIVEAVVKKVDLKTGRIEVDWGKDW